MSEVVHKAEWLVSIPSPTKSEEELCQQLLHWADGQLPQAKIARHRCGFLLEPGPQLAGRDTIALVGHIDTVPPAQQQRLGILDGKLYGCGASDMKSGVAVMMVLLERYAQWNFNLVGLFYDREEGPYDDNGLDGLLDQLGQRAVRLAVVLEPTNNQIQAGCVGSLQARAHFRGKRAHSARPWQGDNAIHKAIPLLQRLAERQPHRVVCQGLEFFEVVTATQALSPGPSNAVPELFSLNLNSRFAPGKSVEDAIGELQALVNQEADLEILDAAPAGTVQLEDPVLQRWIASEQLQLQPKQAWTDVARLSLRGIPAFNFGPGDPAQAHQSDEFVELQAIEENLRLLSALLQA